MSKDSYALLNNFRQSFREWPLVGAETFENRLDFASPC